ncbi:MAG: DUF748 domain-containing protein [Campylobacterales bacterium]|nr:DUF748 domain-containing protein [Campylobacterales bacterium]
MFKKILISTVLIYTIFGFFILPYLLKSQIIKTVQNSIYADMAIDDIKFNPYTFKLDAKDITIVDANQKKLFSLDGLSINIELHSLIDATIHIKDIILKNPNITLSYDGEFNFEKLLKPSAKSDESFTILRVLIDKISIEDGGVFYDDFTKKPIYQTSLTNLNFELKDIDTKQLQNSDAKFKLHFVFNNDGSIKLKTKILSFEPLVLKGGLEFENFELYSPYKYLKDNLNLEVADGVLNLDSSFYIDMGDANKTKIDVTNLSLDKLRLKPKDKNDDILNLKNITLSDATIFPFSNSMQVKNISLDALYSGAYMGKDGGIDWTRYIKTNFKSGESKDATNPWSVKLDGVELRDSSFKFSNANQKIYDTKLKNLSLKNIVLDADNISVDNFYIKDSKFDFYDKTLKKTATFGFDKIDINISNIATKKDIFSNYTLDARLDKAGYIKSKGEFNLSQLKQKGSLIFEHLPLNGLNPYIGENLHLKLKDGFLNLDAKLGYEQSQTKPDIELRGLVELNSIKVQDTRDKTTLVKLDRFTLKSFELELFPNRLYVDKATLDSFYLKTIINKDKSMNLSTLQKVASNKNTDAKREKSEPFNIKVMELNIKNGKAKFEDNSLPIDFKTDIHSLDGMIYAISSSKDETSYVDIDGEVDKYGSVKLKGSVDAGDIKKYMDLDLNFRNLDLSSISGYSAVFAGHKIVDGRLFLDLGYEIMDSKLNSSNSIIIKNIKLGEEYKDSNTTPLPLRFAIALLEDSDGVIDIDMPIQGDIDNPDFKYRALVFKTFFKLIGSAVTSPFRFLGAILGVDGDKLSYMEFEKGKSYLIPSEKEKLENISKIMIKKPKISIAITPTYDEIFDRYEIQKEKFIDIVVKKANLESRKNHINALNIELLENIYKELDKDANIENLKDELKQKYDDKEFESEYLKRLQKLCIDGQKVTKDELENLAKNRVQVITEYLINDKKVDAHRFKTKEVKVLNLKETNYIKLDLKIEKD